MKLSQKELLSLLASLARKFSCCPISNFRVGVAGLCESGNVYLGVNLEFPGLPLFYSVHGEQFLISRLLSNEERLTVLAVNVALCGHCRQFMKEVDAEESVQILVGDSGVAHNLQYFLTDAFGPKDILTGGTRLLASAPQNLVFNDLPSDPTKYQFSERIPMISAKLSILRISALKAASNSYSFYSQSPSGVAIMTYSGSVYTGSYIESAAYNPSLSPLHAALINLWAEEEQQEQQQQQQEQQQQQQWEPSWKSISHVVLVERQDAPVSQMSILDSLKMKHFPDAHVYVFYVAMS